MGYVFIGIFVGIIVGKYIFSLLDLFIEYVNVRVSEKASVYQGKMQLLQYKIDERCSPKQPAIGFSMDDTEETAFLDDDDDDDDEGRLKIGF